MRTLRARLADGPTKGLIAWVVIFGGFVFGAYQLQENRDLIDRIEREGVERRQQSCQLFESDHLADVQALRRTYHYLGGLSARERRTGINRALLVNLPRTEQEARTDSAPDFCDKPGVGLPEPDPVVPERPRGL
jgi:hypothetical protein